MKRCRTAMIFLCLMHAALCHRALYAETLSDSYRAGADFAESQLPALTASSQNSRDYHNAYAFDAPTGDTKAQAKNAIEANDTPAGQIGAFVAGSIIQQSNMRQNHPDIAVKNNPDLLHNSQKILSNASQSLDQTPLYCKDDSCTDTGYSSLSAAERDKYLSAVSALQEAANEVPQTAVSDNYNSMIAHMRTFNGSVYHCRDMMLNYDNCCSDSGWGQKIGLAGCNQTENTLWQKKGQGLCVYVGRYCSHKVMGECTEHKKGYCCFDTLLSRLIQQQARPQLSWNFGSGKSPNCQGFTPTDLQGIDFSRINYSEFYNSLESKMTIPNALSTTAGITKDKVEARMEKDVEAMFGHGA